MRKLLVASQKGGVGKTTTSVNLAAAAAMAGARVLLLDADPLSSISSSLNLAEHPRRQTLRDAGIDLPGVLVGDVIPGLDVLSPYEDGGCSDDELDRLLALLTTRAFREGYGCLLVDTPPFMGANPGQLLSTCDEFVIVMRAEPMAYRTLPAFLELVQRQKTPAGNQAIKMRGILVTLPEGETSGGRWERELRGRFGTRILPEIVPYDDVVNQTRLFGQIVGHEHRESPAAQAYHALAESLALAPEAHDPEGRTNAAEALLLAWASSSEGRPAVRPAPAPAKAPPAPEFAAVPAGPRTPMTKAPTLFVEPAAPEREEEEVDLAEDLAPDLDELDAHILDQAAPVAPLPPVAPSAALPPPVPRLTPPPPRPSAFRPDPKPAVPRPPARAPENAPAKVAPAKVAPAKVAPAKVAPAPTPARKGFPVGVVLVWVGVAMALGIGLRFVDLPDAAIPVVVGLAVAATVILGMVYLMPQQDEEPEPVAAPAPPTPPRPAGKPSNRLSGYTRRTATKSGRGVGGN